MNKLWPLILLTSLLGGINGCGPSSTPTLTANKSKGFSSQPRSAGKLPLEVQNWDHPALGLISGDRFLLLKAETFDADAVINGKSEKHHLLVLRYLDNATGKNVDLLQEPCAPGESKDIFAIATGFKLGPGKASYNSVFKFEVPGSCCLLGGDNVDPALVNEVHLLKEGPVTD